MIVGAGGSGLAAALSAAELGAKVILLEKNPQPGGTTGIAVGSFTAAGTSFQNAKGIADDPDSHHEDMGKFAGEREPLNNAPLRLHFARHAAETLEWLRSLGIDFHGPSPEPPNRVPRMHNVVPNAKAYIATLQRLAQRRGAEIRCGCVAKSLLKDDAGRIVGVAAEMNGRTVEAVASKAVILAAGDYANGAEIKTEFLSPEIAEIEGINPRATGDGHRLGRQAGADWANMDVVYGPEIRFVPPPRKPFTQLLPTGPIASRVFGTLAAWAPKSLVNRFIKKLLVTWQHPEPTVFRVGGILVNRRGERFCDETGTPERSIARQPQKEAFILVDSRIGRSLEEWPNYISTAPDIAYAYLKDYRRDRRDVYFEAASLGEMAGMLNVDRQRLERSVAAYNESARGNSEDVFGRTNFGPPLESPPFIALGPARSYIVTTEGGLRIDESMRVLDVDGAPLPGLYAAGCNGLGGQILWGHGLHIAWALTSGRLAGRNAAKSEA